jgi:hypothetical protein
MVMVHVASGTRDILVFWAAWLRLWATPYTIMTGMIRNPTDKIYQFADSRDFVQAFESRRIRDLRWGLRHFELMSRSNQDRNQLQSGGFGAVYIDTDIPHRPTVPIEATGP